VWTGSPFLRRQRDQVGVLDPAAPALAKFSAELEYRADRFSSGGPLRHQSRRTQPGPAALGPRAVLGQGRQSKVGFANINAKAEGIETKPAFREAFQRRRCLVPVDNFYEWAKTGPGSSLTRSRSPTGA
jgi:SOS response associated peptidase (SRAP)